MRQGLVCSPEGLFLCLQCRSQVSHAKLWRTSVAHDIKYMDLAATSLATRVCKDARRGKVVGGMGGWGCGRTEAPEKYAMFFFSLKKGTPS